MPASDRRLRFCCRQLTESRHHNGLISEPGPQRLLDGDHHWRQRDDCRARLAAVIRLRQVTMRILSATPGRISPRAPGQGQRGDVQSVHIEKLTGTDQCLTEMIQRGCRCLRGEVWWLFEKVQSSIPLGFAGQAPECHPPCERHL